MLQSLLPRLLLLSVSHVSIQTSVARAPANVTNLSGVFFRVEALSGRSSIKAVALGAQHTLFLDSKGAVYSCGENKEV